MGLKVAAEGMPLSYNRLRTYAAETGLVVPSGEGHAA